MKNFPSVFLLSIFSFILVTIEFLPIGLLGYIKDIYKISSNYAGLLISIPGLVAAIFALLVSNNLSLNNNKNLIILISIFLSTSTLFMVVFDSFFVLMISYLVIGVCVGVFWSISLTIVSQLVHKEKVPFATSILFTGAALSMVIGIPFSTLISYTYGWKYSLLLLSLLSFINTYCLYRFLPNNLSRVRCEGECYIKILSTPESLVSNLLVLLIFLSQFMTYTYFSDLVATQPYLEIDLSSLLLIFGLSGVLFNFIFGLIVNKFRFTAVILLFLGLMISFIFLNISGSQHIFVMLIVLWGGVWGALPPTLRTWQRTFKYGDSQYTSSLFVSINQIATALGAFVGGVIINDYNMEILYFSSSFIVFISIILLIYQYKNRDYLANLT